MNKYELQEIEHFRKKLEEQSEFKLIKEKYNNGESEASIIKNILSNEDILTRRNEMDAFLLVKIFEYVDNNRHIDDFIKCLISVEKEGLTLIDMSTVKVRYCKFKEYSLAKAGLKKKELETQIKEIESKFDGFFINETEEVVAEIRANTQIELLKALINNLEDNMKNYGTEKADEDYEYWITTADIENCAKELNINMYNTKYNH